MALISVAVLKTRRHGHRRVQCEWGGGITQWRRFLLNSGGRHGEREPITGVWGQSSQRGPGAEPEVRGQGNEVE